MVVLLHRAPLAIFAATDSALLSGLAMTATTLPAIVIGPFVGILVDRWPRAWVMFWVAALQSVVLLAFAILGGTGGLWLELAVVLALVTLAVFAGATKAGSSADSAGPELLVSANSLNALNYILARILGPVTGAVIFARIGFGATTLAGAVTLIVAATLLSQLRVTASSSSPADRSPASGDGSAIGGMWSDLAVGIAAVRHRRLLIATFTVFGLIVIAEAPLNAVLIPFVDQTLDAGPEGHGTILSVRGISGLVGSLAMAQIGMHLRANWLLTGSCFVIGAAILAIDLIRSFPVTVAIFLVIGSAVIALQIGAVTLIQRGTDNAIRGRVFSLLGAMSGLLALPSAPPAARSETAGHTRR